MRMWSTVYIPWWWRLVINKRLLVLAGGATLQHRKSYVVITPSFGRSKFDAFWQLTTHRPTGPFHTSSQFTISRSTFRLSSWHAHASCKAIFAIGFITTSFCTVTAYSFTSLPRIRLPPPQPPHLFVVFIRLFGRKYLIGSHLFKIRHLLFLYLRWDVRWTLNKNDAHVGDFESQNHYQTRCISPNICTRDFHEKHSFNVFICSEPKTIL